MKKGIMKLCAIAMLPVLLLVGGCSKDETSSHVGVYNLEYSVVMVDGEMEFRMNSCDVLDGLFEGNDKVDEIIDTCKAVEKVTLELTKDGYFKMTDGETTRSWKYLIDETGNFLVSPLETEIHNSKIAGVYYDLFTFENGRFYMEDGLYTSNTGDVSIVSVFSKTNG